MATITNHPATRDQAGRLRTLLERYNVDCELPYSTGCRTIAVTSGKGGVGKSHLALNLAVALAQSGRAVCLMDGNLGLGSLDLLCGLNGYWNLSHVVTGARQLEDVILSGPAGIHLIPGGSGIASLADCPPHVQRQLLSQMHSLELEHDVLLIDTGSGIHQLVRQFALAADDILVVTTPEPTSIADAYATIKVLSAPKPRGCHSSFSGCELHVVVNQSDSPEKAQQILERLQQTARLFLSASIGLGGQIPRDVAVTNAVLQRRPFVETEPNSAATRAVRQLAERLVASASRPCQPEGYFARLWARLGKSA